MNRLPRELLIFLIEYAPADVARLELCASAYKGLARRALALFGRVFAENPGLPAWIRERRARPRIENIPARCPFVLKKPSTWIELNTRPVRLLIQITQFDEYDPSFHIFGRRFALYVFSLWPDGVYQIERRDSILRRFETVEERDADHFDMWQFVVRLNE